MKAIHKRRLLECADIAEKVPYRLFDMGTLNYKHDCKKPACALGHYAMKHPRIFHGYDGWIFTIATAHFGITDKEAAELFGGIGCGDAQTGKQAARYIRNFV